MTPVINIPGIGKTFEKDLARIGVKSVEHLVGKNAEDLFMELKMVNAAEEHQTSKNYLYVIRMCIYYANGGRSAEKLKWSAWKDKP